IVTKQAKIQTDPPLSDKRNLPFAYGGSQESRRPFVSFACSRGLLFHRSALQLFQFGGYLGPQFLVLLGFENALIHIEEVQQLGSDLRRHSSKFLLRKFIKQPGMRRVAQVVLTRTTDLPQ